MVSENSPDWLPSGWTMHLKTNDFGRKVKCYIDPASGRKFYSKSQVSRYLETLNSCSTPQRGISSADNIVEERNESPEWLPHGWTVESKTRNSGSQIGKKFKIYIEPVTGCKFYSKPEVSRYLKKISSGTAPQIGIGSVNDHSIGHSTRGGTSSKPDVSQNSKKNKSSISEQKSSISEQKKLHGGKHSMNNVVVESVSVRELPPGWITEIRSRKNVNPKHKDLYYTDPVSGYVFRSKPDALRYLETGDINRCKIKPKKRDTNDLVSLNNGISQSMDHSTGDRTSSKPDVSQSCKTNKISITKQKKLHGGKNSTNNVVIERVSADEFPAGWIKEITTRKIADRIHKDSYYTDPVSGYKFFSKTDALRYLKSGDINSCKIKPKKRDINDLELINDGDISHSMDHLNVGGTSSNPDVALNCKTDDSSMPKQKKLNGGKHSVNDAVVERVSADEFPPGWIKEIRTRKVGNRIQKDPYYKDPVTGYVFRSKPDALRYLETGDINSCKMKPKKRDINDLELNDEDLSPSSAVVGKKLNSTTRRLRFGKERSDICLSSSLVAPEVGNSKERRVNVSDATMDIASPPVEIPEAKRTKNSEPISKDSKREESIKVSAANEIISSVINDILQEEKLSENGTVKHSSRKAQSSIKSKNKRTLSLPFRASKRLAGLKPEMQPDNSIITQALPAAAIDGGETEANPLSNLTLNASVHKVPQQLEAEAERKVAHDASTVHIESSNRSGRLEDQSVLEKQPGREEAEKHKDDKPEKKAAHHASISRETIIDVESLNKREKELQEAVPEKQPGMEEAEKHNDDKPVKEAAHYASISRETILDVESLNKREKELQEAVPEKQPGRQVTGKQNEDRPESQEPPLDYPFMDSWTDPCLEFAFKTLTGAIPVEENLSFHDYFQAEAPQTQKNGGLEQPESVSPSVTQNDATFNFEAKEKSVPAQQLPANPTYLSPGDVSLPSCSITNPQQSSLEAGNNETPNKGELKE